MLLRIKRPLAGSVDGIDLTQFDPGRVYSVTAEFGCYLLALAAAEPVEGNAEPLLWAGRNHLPSAREEHLHTWTGPERRRHKR